MIAQKGNSALQRALRESEFYTVIHRHDATPPAKPMTPLVPFHGLISGREELAPFSEYNGPMENGGPIVRRARKRKAPW